MAYARQDKNVDPLPILDDGDLAFSGMDMRAPPLVQPGFASSAKNMRIEDGVYLPRKGLFTPTWTGCASEDFPYRASYYTAIDETWASTYSTTYGSCIYSDPSDGGDTWIVRVCANVLMFFRETEVGRIIPFDPGLTVSGPVIVFQNFNQLIINRGGSESSLVWDGSFSDTVSELVPSSIASGYAAVPVASYGLAWRERTVLLSGRDSLILTRIADSTQYHETDGIFYVNRGAGDTLRAAVPVGAYSLLILKSQSLHVFSSSQADLSDARLDIQAVEMRFDSPKTAVAADGKVWWLDRRGVRNAWVEQIDADNKVQIKVDSTVSDRIRPLINRINWQYASLFSAAVTTDRIYFAVALDDQTTPQTILVWNRIFSSWESYDQWNTSTLTFNIQSLVSNYEWLSEPRIFAVSDAGMIACMNYGLGDDHVGWDSGGLQYPKRATIQQEFVSRGYTTGMNDTKLFKLAKIQLDTWNPGTLSVVASFDGPEEDSALASISRDRTKYFTGLSDFVLDNSGDNFSVGRRQDYSIALTSDEAVSGYSNWTYGTTYSNAGAGDRVYYPVDGHNYKCIGGNLAGRSNKPNQDLNEWPTYWQRLGTTDEIGGGPYDPWVEDTLYYPGDRVSVDGYVWGALVEHDAHLENNPPSEPAYWLDLGLDTAISNGGGIYLQDGIVLEQFQPAMERRTINREAVWCQISVSNTQGAFKIRSMAIEAQPGNRTNSTHA